MSPWREAFPEFKDNPHGTALAGARHKEGLTQRQLSELTFIKQRHISEITISKTGALLRIKELKTIQHFDSRYEIFI